MLQSELVEPFLYGNHLHYPEMPECEQCVMDNLGWDRVFEKTPRHILGEKIGRCPAWRAYVQARPFDSIEPVISLDMMMDEKGYVAKGAEGPQDAYASQEIVDEFTQTLTSKQRRILTKLLRGWKPKEIYQEEGYLNTGGVRYHKFIIRQKYKEFHKAQE